ncbi:hypothetical protein ACFXTO_027971 [Malus domestica]
MAPTGCSCFPVTLERSKKGSFKFVRNSSSLSGSSKSLSLKEKE